MTAQLGLDFATVDVFTQTRFEGNPLAIVKTLRYLPLWLKAKSKLLPKSSIT